MTCQKAVVEAFASLGARHMPRFHWDAKALSVKGAIEDLAINKISLPAEDVDSEALIGLAVTLSRTHKLIDRSLLPEKKYRRLAVASLMFGAAIAEVVGEVNAYEHKLAQMLNEAMQDRADNGAPLLHHVLPATVCVAKVDESKFPELHRTASGILAINAANEKAINLMRKVAELSIDAKSTSDFADIAAQIFPDVGEQVQDEFSDEQNQHQEGIQQQSASGADDLQSSNQSNGDSDVEKAAGATDNESNFRSESAHAQSEESLTDDGKDTKKHVEAVTCSKVAPEMDGNEAAESECQVANVANKEEESEVTADGKACDQSLTDEAPVDDEHSNEGAEGNAKPEALEQLQKPEDEVTSHSTASGVEGSTEQAKPNQPGEVSSATKHPTLVAEIMRALQAEGKRTISLERSGRNVSAKDMWRLKRLGDSRIFKHQSVVMSNEVALEVLLDGSESMSNCIQDAADIALAFCNATSRLPKTSSALSIFGGQWGVRQTLLEHGENPEQVKSKVSFVYASGGTPTGSAMCERMQNLLRQRQKRKLMVVITDGKAQDLAKTLRTVESCKRSGIELLGIGIGIHGKAIREFLPDALTVNSVYELPAAMRKLL